MPYRRELKEEAELAKLTLSNSSLDDRNKKTLLHLINTSTEAINSSNVEEKFQKTAEAISGLILTHITFLDCVDKKIDAANREQCKNCTAMAHTTEYNERIKEEQLFEKWSRENNIPYNPHTNFSTTCKAEDSEIVVDKETETTISFYKNLLKKAVVTPWFWICVSVFVCSPYSIKLLDMILSFFK